MRSSMTVRIAFRNSIREFVRCSLTAGETPTNSRTVSISFAAQAALISNFFIRIDCNFAGRHAVSFISTVRTLLSSRARDGDSARHRSRQSNVAAEAADLHHQLVALLEQLHFALVAKGR